MLAANKIDDVVLLRDEVDEKQKKAKEQAQILAQQEFEVRQMIEEQRVERQRNNNAIDLFRAKVWLG